MRIIGADLMGTLSVVALHVEHAVSFSKQLNLYFHNKKIYIGISVLVYFHFKNKI